MFFLNQLRFLYNHTSKYKFNIKRNQINLIYLIYKNTLIRTN
jgi:hypothetical protein